MFGCGLVCVGCRNCSGKRVTGGIRLLDGIAIFCLYGWVFIRVGAFVIGVPLTAWKRNTSLD